MKTTHWIFIGLVAALAVMTGAVLFSAQPEASAAPAGSAGGQPDGQAWPDPGVYVFFDWSNMDPTQYPYITGGHEVATWSNVETLREGQYNWTWLDSWIADNAVLGNPVALGFNSYDGQCCSGPEGHWLPAWFMQQHPDGYVDCNGVILPRYWSESYLTAFGNWIRAAAARYDNDPRVAWIEVSHGIYGESTPAENEFDACLVEAGLTSDLWVQTVNAITDIYVDAWQEKPLLMQHAPWFLDRRERREFTDYAGALGVGMKHNKLLVDHDDQVIDDPNYFLYRSGQYDPMLTFAGQVPTGWEVYRNYFDNRSDTMWALLNGMDKHPTYLLVTRSLLVTNDPVEQHWLDFANRYAGRTLADTPSVWVALRETLYDWYPQRGNFQFWLYQNDNAPGGRTVPAWNVTNYPEGRYTRRTNEITGNPYMVFDVDDGYIFGATQPVTLTITYLDRGYDAWELHYDGQTSDEQLAGRVQKSNSNRWLKQTFVLDDAELAGGLPGGGDFRIWSGDDGDETIHFVDLVRSPGDHGSGLPTPTPTSQPPDPTPTPTATPQPQQPGPDMSAGFLAAPLAVDGDLGDWPVDGESWTLDRTTANYVNERSIPEPEDASARFSLAWDVRTLYVSAVISDSEQIADSLDVWRDDGLEIGIDGLNDHVDGGADDQQFTATLDGRLTSLASPDVAGALIATQSYTTHYIIELALPVAALGLDSLNAGQALGFTLGLHDDDDGGDWDSYLIQAGSSTLDSGADWDDLHLVAGQTYTITGHTWYDINANGLRDPAENDPLSLVPIALMNYRDQIVASTYSDDDGNWRLAGLPVGAYTVMAGLPPALFATTPMATDLDLPAAGDALVDFGFIGSTAVRMQRFELNAQRDGVDILWQTAHENDNNGFFVYRRANAGGQEKPLTMAPVTSQAPPGAGAEYALRDENIAPGYSYSYWIETVPNQQAFGPLSVTVPLGHDRHHVFLPAVGR